MKKLKKKFKEFYKSFIFNLSANNNAVFIGFYKYLYKPKPNSISSFLDKYSRSKDEVFTLQIGANDGFNHDPIHKFIKRDKWSGVLVEPQKYVHDTFLKKLHHKSDKIQTINAALGEQDGIMPIYKISFTNERWATGLTSFIKQALVEKVDDGSIDILANKKGIETPKSKSDYIAEEQIEVIGASTLKNKFKINKVDVLMIDTEGFDYEVIKMLSKVEIKTEVIIFEHSHFSDEDLNSCKDFLNTNDYLFKMINANTIVVKSNTLAEEVFKTNFLI